MIQSSAKGLTRQSLCYLLIAAAAFSFAVTAPAVRADNPLENADLTIDLDLKAFEESNIGKKLLNSAIATAGQELDQDPEKARDAVLGSLGFDPFKEEVKIHLRAHDLQPPNWHVWAEVQMKSTTGNLEGLLLAAPGYESSEVGGSTIHSVDLDGSRLFLKFTDGDSGAKKILVSSDKSALEKAQPQSASDSASKMLAGSFLRVDTTSVLGELARQSPYAQLAEFLESASISLGQRKDDVVISITLVASVAEKAKQFQQLAEGLTAMVSLFEQPLRDELGDSDTAKELLNVLDRLSVVRDDKAVTIEAAIPESIVIEFLRNEADLPL